MTADLLRSLPVRYSPKGSSPFGFCAAQGVLEALSGAVGERRYQMRYQLSCGHVGLWGPNRFEWPPAEAKCSKCQGRVTKLTAVECREWKISCNQCPYARWVGQFKSGADSLANRHGRMRPGHQMNVDYLKNPEFLARMRLEGYPRSVKPYIVQGPPVKFLNSMAGPAFTAPTTSEPFPDVPPF